ncbi:hypothetical protein LEP1GSC161_2628 [Leptospira santarosai str. CBC1416]|uniref:Uncharacterized protein n=1 Tax=Leptospira santarosai str. CBC1416 TaxID=1193059 RepID=M6VQ58_9LEPT|nr:hypothetical protein LEP1GSC161_2628 [Leptospira santarosai str. CBC1416]
MKKEQKTLEAMFSKLYLSKITQVGSRFFLLIFVFSTMLFCIPGKKTSNSKVMFLAWLVGEMNSYKESQVYENAKYLTGPLGQVEYRGLDFFDNAAFNGIGKYNWQEAGDATFNVGVVLGAMAWKYKNTRDPDTLFLIKRYVNYYKLMQSLNNGGFGRNFVNIEAYNQFLPCNKNGAVGVPANNAPCGTMRYTDYVFEDQHYKFRYDFSLDAVIHSLIGLYWTYQYVDELKPDIVQICENLLRYYERNNYEVKDSNNVVLRYGDHRSAINPVAKINEVILKYIARGQMTDLGAWKDILTLGSVVIKLVVQAEDANFFNHYMLLKGVGVLVNMGYPLQNGLKNLINAVNDQGHELADSMDIYFFQTSKIHVKDKGGFPLYNYHCLADQTFSDIIGLFDRKPYNKWEFSPYRRCVIRQPSALGLNPGFLEAYWLW